MKPDFALTLSHDGIGLLRRAGADRWTRLGEIALDDPRFETRLAALRRRAAGTDTPLAAKLVLPQSEVLYTWIDAPGPDIPAQIEAALEGQTPYALDELVYDWRDEGGRVHVAVAARETLAEAEAFAEAHGFLPLAIAAIPGEDRFGGAEPVFGETRAAAELARQGEAIDRDPVQIIIGPPATPDAPAATPAPTDDAADGPADPGAEPADDTPPPDAPSPKAEITAPAEATADAPPADAAAPAESAADGAPAPDQDPPIMFSRSTRGKDTAAPSAPVADDPASAPAEPAPPAMAATAPLPRFRSRRQNRKAKAPRAPVATTPSAPDSAVAPPPPAAAARSLAPGSDAPDDEARKLTVFGARETAAAEPRVRPGLVVTLVLLALLAAVAIWAALYLPGDRLARLFSGPAVPPVTEAADPPAEEAALPPAGQTLPDRPPAPAPAPDDTAPPPAAAASDPELAPEPEPVPAAPAPQSLAGDTATAPALAAPPMADGLAEELYIPGRDRRIMPQDPVVLPDYAAGPGDARLPTPLPPAPAGTAFDIGPDGRVVATGDGALTPDGTTVYAGSPPAVPPARPAAAAPPPPPDPLKGKEPRPRPEGLAEQTEITRLGGRTRDELAQLRPRPRTSAPAATATATPGPAPDAPVTGGTALAVRATITPAPRPDNFESVVSTARRTPAAALSAPAAPTLPTSASVARQATVENAIRLNRINLIGVYGSASNRRALVRLSNGRYVKVEVGDRLDGGQVAAIGRDALRYVKRGRNIVLELPGDG